MVILYFVEYYIFRQTKLIIPSAFQVYSYVHCQYNYQLHTYISKHQHSFTYSLPHVLSVSDGVSETDEQKSERVGQEAGDTNKTDDDKETSTLTDKLEDLTVKGAKSSDSDASKEEGDSKDKPGDSNETKAA